MECYDSTLHKIDQGNKGIRFQDEKDVIQQISADILHATATAESNKPHKPNKVSLDYIF